MLRQWSGGGIPPHRMEHKRLPDAGLVRPAQRRVLAEDVRVNSASQHNTSISVTSPSSLYVLKRSYCHHSHHCHFLHLHPCGSGLRSTICIRVAQASGQMSSLSSLSSLLYLSPPSVAATTTMIWIRNASNSGAVYVIRWILKQCRNQFLVSMMLPPRAPSLRHASFGNTYSDGPASSTSPDSVSYMRASNGSSLTVGGGRRLFASDAESVVAYCLGGVLAAWLRPPPKMRLHVRACVLNQ